MCRTLSYAVLLTITATVGLLLNVIIIVIITVTTDTVVCVCDLSGELNANRPVPFRLTPNIAEFLTIIGVTGPLTAAMLVTARCFVYPPYKISSYLWAILRDEYITWHKKVSATHILCILLL